MSYAIRIAALLLLVSVTGFAQGEMSVDTTGSSAPDSLGETNAVPFAASSRIDTIPSEYTPAKSPWLAVLFSAVVPGAGQVYAASYWKVPIIVGFGVYFASQWLDNNRRYRDYRDKFRASITPDLPSGNPQYLQLREFYKDQRDTFTWYFTILYFLNLADAYVDASLYDFDVGNDLSIRLMSDPGRGLSLQVRF